ncbi:MAG TPA: SHOCT domain-containing protein [Anaerolineae bacterium]|nr:SHOCT domain-containing protein [Anaerolineae bacterium]
MFWLHGFGAGWTIFGGVMMLLFWIALIVLVVVAIRTLTRSNYSARSSSVRALEILKERYARGEITKDQFDSMQHDLKT